MEQRTARRIYQHYPIRVAGVDLSGRRFKVETVVDNISYGGCYFYLTRLPPAVGTKLFCVVQLSPTEVEEEAGVRVALYGRVLRTELKVSGACGIAAAFTKRRRLSRLGYRKL